MDLRGTVTLITGGGTGLGKAIALGIAREGGHVAVNYSRSKEEAEATVGELRGLGVEAHAVQGDVGNAEQARRIVAETVERFGRLDNLVNNAGTTVFVPFQNLDGISDDDWDRVMRINVKGPFMVSRAAAPHLKQARGGILITASVAGTRPSGSSLVYSCSKAAAVMLARGLAVALAPEVRVNALAPGLLETRWIAGFGPEQVQRSAERSLLKRIATVDDTAAIGIALLKNESVTGQVVAVDCGQL